MSGQFFVLMIGVLIGLAGLVAMASRHPYFGLSRLQPKAGRTLTLHESLALDPRRRLHLVACGNRRVLLLTGGAQDLVVGWMSNP